jgi:hypothetical protein
MNKSATVIPGELYVILAYRTVVADGARIVVCEKALLKRLRMFTRKKEGRHESFRGGTWKTGPLN